MRTEDGHIIRECLNGDSASFGLLVDKYKESIYALAYSRLRNFHDAEDITQDVFLKAYRNLRTLRRWDSFLVWIRSIAINLCKNRIRAQSRRPDAESIEDQETQILDKVSADFYSDEQSSISRDEALDSLNKALESLPEVYQQVLTLHYLGGMSGEQMSQFLGISHANVRQRLSRARRQLREETLAMMSSTYEQQSLPAGFTFRIVEAVKHIKIHPVPRMAGLPWGLSFATGIIVAVLSLNPRISMQNSMSASTSSPLSAKAKVLKTGEIPVDILNISPMQIISSNQGDGNADENELPDLQNALYMAPQAEGGEWTAKSEMPTARAGACSAVVDDRIYVIGGGEAIVGKPFSAVEEYNPATDIWERKADMPEGRVGCSASAVNGKIHVIGGETEAEFAVSTIEEYDPATDSWKTKADMPTARTALSTSVVNGKIYAIGGAVDPNAFSILSAVEEYDPATDTWMKKADMPTARHAASSGVVDGKIYVIGGWAGNVVSSAVEEYNPVTNTWSKKAPIPTPREYLSVCELDGKLYAIGGQGNPGVLPIVEVYDPVTDTWTTEPGMPTARVYLTTDVVKGKIYAIGGSTQNFNPKVIRVVLPILGTVEEYDAGFTSRSVETKDKLPTKWGEVKSGSAVGQKSSGD
jgi:RNA polymerase sigma factor (sigma-70 family)